MRHHCPDTCDHVRLVASMNARAVMVISAALNMVVKPFRAVDVGIRLKAQLIAKGGYYEYRVIPDI